MTSWQPVGSVYSVTSTTGAIWASLAGCEATQSASPIFPCTPHVSPRQFSILVSKIPCNCGHLQCSLPTEKAAQASISGPWNHRSTLLCHCRDARIPRGTFQTSVWEKSTQEQNDFGEPFAPSIAWDNKVRESIQTELIANDSLTRGRLNVTGWLPHSV
jgi:hypothetical protein